MQLPFESQHPMHVAAQPLLLSSPEMTVLPSSDKDASSLDPGPSSPVGLFRPGPVLVGIGAASTGPASCIGVGILWTASSPSPYVAVDPVAQATRTIRTNQPNRIVRWSVEPMR